MKNLKLLYLILILVTSIKVNAQKEFKGKIIYELDFEIHNPSVSEDMLLKNLGKGTTFLYDSGKFYQTFIDGAAEFEIMDTQTEKYYIKMRNNDFINVYDATKRTGETLIKVEVGKSDKTVLGYTCNFLNLNTRVEVEKMDTSSKNYFTDKILIDGSHFSEIKRDFQDVVYGKMNSIPIKFENNNQNFKVIGTATDIDENYEFNLDKIIQEKIDSFPLKPSN